MRKIYIFLSVFVLASCQDNFDEWNDTEQRRITFDISTDGLFDNYLSMTDEGYLKGCTKSIDGDYKIRVSGFCYDTDGKLIQNSYKLADRIGTESITFFHLLKDHEYRFEFLTDVVETDTAVDFYESWFQLGTDNIDNFYLFCFQPNDIHRYNKVSHATLYAIPENNTLKVSVQPITVNGYCELTNLQNIERVNGYYGYKESFYLNSMTGRMRGNHAYSYIVGDNKKFVIPITTGTVSDTISIKIKRVILNKVDSVYLFIRNPENKPFVSDIDCQTLKMKSCVFY